VSYSAQSYLFQLLPADSITKYASPMQVTRYDSSLSLIFNAPTIDEMNL